MNFVKLRSVVPLILLASVLGISGCSTTASTASKDPVVDLVEEVNTSAKRLLSDLKLSPNKPLLAVSFVDIDNPGSSSTLGRTLGEQFSSAFTSHGVKMIEVKMRNALYIQEGTGELMLSRELKSLVQDYAAQAVVVGTYAQGGSNFYIVTKVVRMDDNIVLSSDSLTLPINRDLRSMVSRR